MSIKNGNIIKVINEFRTRDRCLNFQTLPRTLLVKFEILQHIFIYYILFITFITNIARYWNTNARFKKICKMEIGKYKSALQ